VQAELRRRGDMIKQLEVEQSDSIDEITKLKSQLTAALGDAKALRDRENMNMREVEDARNSVGQLRKEILNGKTLLQQEQAVVVDLKSEIKDFVLKLEDQKSQYVKRDREATHQLNVVNDKLALTQSTLDEVRSELSRTAVELEAERALTAHQQSTIEQMTSQHITEREQHETEQARVHDLMVDTEKRMMEMQTVQFTKVIHNFLFNFVLNL
jgi:chromosome segregation ATPase